MAKGFQKGNNGGPGRPKGMKNIKTWQKEFFLKYIQEEGAGRFMEELEELRGKEYVEQFSKILPYGFAKLAPVDDEGKTVREILVMPAELIEKNDINTSSERDSKGPS